MSKLNHPAAKAAADTISPELRTLAEQAFSAHADENELDDRAMKCAVWINAVRWTLQHLSEQGAGEKDDFCDTPAHAKQAAEIAAYRTSELAMNEKLNAHHDEWQRKFADQDAEMERLRCRVAEYIDLAAKHALEVERLRAEKVGHIQLIGGQEAEIIKLRAELAEFKTARVMSGPEDVREYVHNREVAHAKLRDNK